MNLPSNLQLRVNHQGGVYLTEKEDLALWINVPRPKNPTNFLQVSGKLCMADNIYIYIYTYLFRYTQIHCMLIVDIFIIII